MKTEEKLENGTLLVTDGQLKYIEFECLKKYSDELIHCFSTRVGGVSREECSTLNLGFKRRDTRENVLENYRLLCDSIGIDPETIVLTNQVHGKVVHSVNSQDVGKGFSIESDLLGVDGLVTSMEGVTLVTHHADCIPVFLYEPVIKAAAMLHSGWRGTLAGISAEAVRELSLLEGFSADRLIAVTGPSIGKCCFEVSKDVYELFADKYPDHPYYESLDNGKWKLDLHGMIRSDLIKAGLSGQNIHSSGLCTKCRSDLFFSHRGDAGRTGSLAAFMQIRPSKGSQK